MAFSWRFIRILQAPRRTALLCFRWTSLKPLLERVIAIRTVLAEVDLETSVSAG